MVARKKIINKTVENKQLRGAYFYEFYNNEDCNESHFSESNQAVLFKAGYLLGKGGGYTKRRGEFESLIKSYLENKDISQVFNEKERAYLIEIENISNRGLEKRAKHVKGDFLGSSRSVVGMQKMIAGSNTSLQERIYEPSFAGVYVGEVTAGASSKLSEPKHAERNLEGKIESKTGDTSNIPPVLPMHERPILPFKAEDDETALKKIPDVRREEENRKAIRKGKLKAGLLGFLAGAVIFGIGGCIYSKKQYNSGNETAKSEYVAKLTYVENSWSNTLYTAEKDFETMREKLSSDNLSLTSKYMAATNEVGKLSLENKLLDEEIGAAGYEIISFQSKIEKLDKDKTEKAKRLEILGADYSDLSGKYMAATNEVGKLSAEKSALSDNYDSAINKAQSLGYQNVVLQEEIEAIKRGKVDNSNINLTNLPDKVTQPTGKLGADVDKYREYAISQGSRDSLQSLRKSGNNLKNAGNSLVGAATLSYGTSEFKELRDDDLSIKKSSSGFGKSIVSFFKRLGGPISDKESYRRLNPLTGTANYAGRLVGGAVGVGKNAVNAATLGMGNNIIEPAINSGKNLLESGKHLGQSGLNLTRLPTKPFSGKIGRTSNNILDWIGLVPLEYSSNVLEGEGFSNAENMQQAVKDKGNTGVILESAGSGALLWYGINETLDNPVVNGGRRIDGPGIGPNP